MQLEVDQSNNIALKVKLVSSGDKQLILISTLKYNEMLKGRRCLWKTIQSAALFPNPPPPTSHELQYICVMSGFTRLSMKTKNVCRGFISLYVIFHYNRTMWSTSLHVKIFRWGGEEKEPKALLKTKLMKQRKI